MISLPYRIVLVLIITNYINEVNVIFLNYTKIICPLDLFIIRNLGLIQARDSPILGKLRVLPFGVWLNLIYIPHFIGATSTKRSFYSSPPSGLLKDWDDHVVDMLEYGDQYIDPDHLVKLGTRIYKEGASVKIEEIMLDNSTSLKDIYIGDDKLEDLINNCPCCIGQLNKNKVKTPFKNSLSKLITLDNDSNMGQSYYYDPQHYEDIENECLEAYLVDRGFNKIVCSNYFEEISISVMTTINILYFAFYRLRGSFNWKI